MKRTVSVRQGRERSPARICPSPGSAFRREQTFPYNASVPASGAVPRQRIRPRRLFAQMLRGGLAIGPEVIGCRKRLQGRSTIGSVSCFISDAPSPPDRLLSSRHGNMCSSDCAAMRRTSSSASIKARTTFGSKCVPDPSRMMASALSTGKPFL